MYHSCLTLHLMFVFLVIFKTKCLLFCCYMDLNDVRLKKNHNAIVISPLDTSWYTLIVLAITMYSVQM